MPDLEGFFARVDAHLAELPAHERSHFLHRLTCQWQDRYQNFQQRIAVGAPVSAGVTAFDYIATIAGLDQRAGRLPREAA